MNIEQVLRDAIESKYLKWCQGMLKASLQMNKKNRKIIKNRKIMWNKVSEKELPYGEEVIAFNKKWIDEWFNHNGIRVGFLEGNEFISAEWNNEWESYDTHYGDDYDDVPVGMLDEHHMEFAKPNMPTHWMKMPTHP